MATNFKIHEDDFISCDELASQIPPVTLKEKSLEQLELIRKFWIDVVRDEDAPLTNRVKASELLHRSLVTQTESASSENDNLSIQNISLNQKVTNVKTLIKKLSCAK